jgi:thymidylate synthase
MFIKGPTLDDLLQKTFRRILRNGSPIASKRGHSKELIGVMLELQNPLARLSRTESKGKVFSGLGEFLWYLSGKNDLAFISYYLKKYVNESDDGKTVFGGYGPRLSANREHDQISNVLNLLADKGDSRRAVIQLFNAEDIAKPHKDIPCTCILQFLRRNDHLHMVTYMRSNDAFFGLPHDIFSFTMLQEMMANKLNIKIGKYRHTVGSLHLYDDRVDQAVAYLSEGWQSTGEDVAMPRMPSGDPWELVPMLLKVEGEIRLGMDVNLRNLKLPPYWKDIARLLKIFRVGSSENKMDVHKISDLKRQMSSHVYDIYIDTYFRRRRFQHLNDSLSPQQMELETLFASPSTQSNRIDTYPSISTIAENS